jgi:hypothetical protein
MSGGCRGEDCIVQSLTTTMRLPSAILVQHRMPWSILFISELPSNQLSAGDV